MNVVGRRRDQGRASLRGLLVPAVVCGIALCVPGAAFGTPPCSTHQLQLSFVRETRNAGHVFWDFALRNSGHSECVLHGYPAVDNRHPPARSVCNNSTLVDPIRPLLNVA